MSKELRKTQIDLLFIKNIQNEHIDESNDYIRIKR